MKKYLTCLFILAVILSLSCATTTPTTTSTTQSSPTQQPPATTPPPSTTPATTPPPPPPPPPPQVTLVDGLDMTDAVDYTVVFGDFLSEITRTFYGHLTDVGSAGTRNGFYYPMLMLASGGQIKDPDFILEGMKLKIPDLKKNLANADSRRAIREVIVQTAILYGNKRLADEEAGLRRLADSL